MREREVRLPAAGITERVDRPGEKEAKPVQRVRGIGGHHIEMIPEPPGQRLSQIVTQTANMQMLASDKVPDISDEPLVQFQYNDLTVLLTEERPQR